MSASEFLLPMKEGELSFFGAVGNESGGHKVLFLC